VADDLSCVDSELAYGSADGIRSAAERREGARADELRVGQVCGTELEMELVGDVVWLRLQMIDHVLVQSSRVDQQMTSDQMRRDDGPGLADLVWDRVPEAGRGDGTTDA